MIIPKRNIAKQGNRVVVGGVVGRVGSSNSSFAGGMFGGGSGGASSNNIILQLPEGSRPSSEMSFDLATQVDQRNVQKEGVIVHPDGRIEMRNSMDIDSVSLSGITFETE